MIYAAEINQDGVVLRVTVAPSVEWCVQHLGGTWLQTWINGSQRGKYAGPGDTYDSKIDQFVSPMKAVTSE